MPPRKPGLKRRKLKRKTDNGFDTREERSKVGKYGGKRGRVVVEDEFGLFRAAQIATDETLGEGTYVRLNGFDPSKGEVK